MTSKKIASVFLFFSLISFTAFAQDSIGTSAKLIRFARNAALFSYNNPQEKVYLHFDNTGYFLGETIWFKAYVVEALNNNPSAVSKTLYVELLTPEGDILQSKKIPIQNGICSGDFQLMDSLPGGYYEVRAYTRCMLNFGPEVVFSRVLPVFDQPIKEGNYVDRKMTNRKFTVPNLREKYPFKEQINVSFYPEGGSLVTGLKSNVAFKAAGKDGKSIQITGSVLNSEGKEVATLKTLHDGMGVFSVIPDGKKLTVKVNFEKNENSFQLPASEVSGYVMTVASINNDSLFLTIRKSADLPQNDTLALVVSSRGKLVDFRAITISEKDFFRTTLRKKLPAGVCQFTLYDQLGRIRSERLVFNLPELAFNSQKITAKITAKTNKERYKPYERISLELASDTSVTKFGTSVSVAVRDVATSNFGNSDNSNIITNLLLSSDLKGYIENPAWYFQNNDAEHLLALDQLMLTQGWRRYNWKLMTGVEPFIVKEPIEEGLLLDGEVRSILLKKPMKDVKVNFWMMRGGNAQQGRCLTDSTGKFYFMISEKYDTWEMNIQTSVENTRKEYRILLNRNFSPQPKWYSAYDTEIWTNDQLQLPVNKDDTTAMLLGEVRYATELTASNPEGYKEYQLKEIVKIGERKQTFMQVAARKASIKYDVDKEVDVLQDQGKSEASSITEFLRDTNPNFHIGGGDTPTYRYKSRPVVFKIFSNDTQTQMGATDTRWELSEIVPADVESILIVEDHEVIRNFDPLATNDPVVIMIKTHANGDPKDPIGVRKTIYQAYSVSKEFYSPIHQPGTPLLEADFRRTLYWNPDVILDPQGKAKLEFYNNGLCRKMSISAEGINSKGTLLKYNE
jgi:hypothetical protein